MAGIAKNAFPIGFYQPIVASVFQAFECTVIGGNQNPIVKLGNVVKFFETKEFNTMDILADTSIVAGWSLVGASIARPENMVYCNVDNSVSVTFELPVTPVATQDVVTA
jgi:hypothetical protein